MGCNMRLIDSKGIMLAFALVSASASAQNRPGNLEGGTAELHDQDPIEGIIVTGTRRVDRTAAESTAPIDVFDDRALATEAPSDMNDVLTNLIPSFNVGRQALGGASAFSRPASLRGLASDETLILVNGKRRHRSAVVQTIAQGDISTGSQSVDLNQIPVIAIERIEVLRDGAAAQYGSDAIAGVINYTLRSAREGATVTARAGQYYRGDGESLQAAGNFALPLGAEGFVNISAEYVNAKQTSRAGQRPDALALQTTYPEIYVRNPVRTVGDPLSEIYRLWVNGETKVTDDSRFYFIGNYNESRYGMDFAYRLPRTVQGPNATGTGIQTFSYSRGVFETIYLDRLPNGNYDAAGRTWNANEIYPGGFVPRLKGDPRDTSLALGYAGETSFGLRYDFSANYGANKIDYVLSNTLNPSLGPDTPRSFDVGAEKQSELNFNADFSYLLDLGLRAPVSIAFGAEHREETYKLLVGEPASYVIGPYAAQTVENPDGSTFLVTTGVGANGQPGYSPATAVDKSRSNYSLYLDVEADVLERLTLGAAVRYENYSDFGETTNGKIAARYEFSDAFSMRGTASTGFKAPTAGQLFTTDITSVFLGSATPVEESTLPVHTPAAQYFGAKPLKPEKSRNFSLGFVFMPTSGLTASLDAYRIKVEDRLGMSGRAWETPTLQHAVRSCANLAWRTGRPWEASTTTQTRSAP